MSQERLVCGLHAAKTVLEHTPDKVVAAWVDGQRGDARIGKIRLALEELGLTVQQGDRRRLDKLAGGVNHQGVVLRVRVPAGLGENELIDLLTRLDHPPLLLVLDQVQDPHNLGACLRTADAAGVDGVVVTKDQSVALTPTVLKVASGAAETVPVFRITNLARTLRDLKDAGLWIAGASGDAPQSVYDADLKGPLALVVGGEGKGMRRLTREHCDLLVSLPMRGQVESLNLSVAAGVLLYEVMRQRRVNELPSDLCSKPCSRKALRQAQDRDNIPSEGCYPLARRMKQAGLQTPPRRVTGLAKRGNEMKVGLRRGRLTRPTC